MNDMCQKKISVPARLALHTFRMPPPHASQILFTKKLVKRANLLRSLLSWHFNSCFEVRHVTRTHFSGRRTVQQRRKALLTQLKHKDTVPDVEVRGDVAKASAPANMFSGSNQTCESRWADMRARR